MATHYRLMLEQESVKDITYLKMLPTFDVWLASPIYQDILLVTITTCFL
jgi:hypothetical protein